MTLLLANSAASTLTAAITAGATTITVVSTEAALFPIISVIGDYALLTLEDTTVNPVVREIVKATARSGPVLTVQRAQEGTTAHAFPIGATVSLRLTAGSMAAVAAQAIATLKQYAGVLRVITDLTASSDPDGIVYAEGNMGIYTSTSTLYVRRSGAWVPAVSFSNLTGNLANGQVLLNSIDFNKLAGLIAAGQIAPGTITFPDLGGQISSTQITPGAILTPALGANQVTTVKLLATDIVANLLLVQTGYVDTAQIVNLAVTNAKIANLTVTTAKIADANITTAKIADANITTAKIADANITSAKIADANITSAKIGNLEVNTFHLVDGSVTQAPTAGFTINANLGIGDLCAIPVTVTNNSKVILTAKIGLVDASATFHAQFTLRRNPATVLDTGSGLDGTVLLTAVDTVAAGNYVYTFACTNVDATRTVATTGVLVGLVAMK